MLSKWISRTVELIRDSFERFPVTMFFAVAVTIIGQYLLGASFSDPLQTRLTTWALAALLGIPLSIALHLRLEMAPVPMTWKATLFGMLIAIIIGYGLWLPGERIDMTHNVLLQWGLLFLTAHIFVSISIHRKGLPDRNFWAFNMHTLMRLILGVLFTAVLNVGVILAIVASDFLFNLDLSDKIYMRVTFFNHGILMTAIIVAGIPRFDEDLEWVRTVPKALRLFCLYVLLPLAFLYLSILLLYSGKVILEWSLPKGIVGSMILYYAIVGYVTHLLTLPFQDEDSKSTVWFGKFFRYTMPAVLILFWVAIGLRVDSYGLTILRGLVIYLGVWLTGISVWALFTKGRPIVMIPATLGLVLAIGAIGPVSISTMSRSSQLGELRALLSAAPGESDQERIRNTSELDSTSIARINSGIFYLTNSHGIRSLEPFFSEPFDTMRARFEREDSMQYTMSFEFTNKLMKEWNIPSPWNLTQDEYVTFNTTAFLSADIRGYDYYKTLQYYPRSEITDTVAVFNNDYIEVFIDPKAGLLVRRDSSGNEVSLDIIAHIKSMPYSMNRGFVELNATTAEIADTSGGTIKLLIDSGNIRKTDGTWVLQSLQGKLFLKTTPN